MGFNTPFKGQFEVRDSYTWSLVSYTINIVALLAATALVVGALLLLGIVGH